MIKQDEFLGLPELLRPVVEKYSRTLVALVYEAGMAAEAAKVIAQSAQARRDAQMHHAIVVLSSAYNRLSTAYAKKMGWGEEVMAQCDRDIKLAFASAVQTVKSKIILEH